MLSASDMALAGRDPDLGGLHTILDGDAFARLLRQVGLSKADTVQACYVRYKPGTNCVIQYRLEEGDPIASVYAIAFHRSQRAKLAKLAANAPVGVHLLQENDIAIYPFGLDRRLPALALMPDAARRHEHLSRLLPRFEDLWSADLLTLRYKPERRYVGCLDGSEQRAVVKLYTPCRYPIARYNSKAFCSQGSLVLARRLAAAGRRGILVTEWIPGCSMDQHLSQPEVVIPGLRRAGRALAKFHVQRPRRIRGLNRAGERLALANAIGSLLEISPREKRRLTDLQRRLNEPLRRPQKAERSIHGDFSLDQLVLMDDGRVALLDLDHAARGDPMVDFASFAARLEVDAVYGRLPRKLIAPYVTALLDGYAQSAAPPEPEYLSFYVAARTVRLAVEPFRYRHRAWSAQTAAILTRAEELTERCSI